MNAFRTRLLLALIPAVFIPACDSGGDEGATSLTSTTTGTDDTDGSGSDSETLSTTITASSTDGTTTDSGTDSASTSGPSSTTTADPTDPTTDGTTGGDQQVATIYEIQDGTITPGTSVLVEGVIITGLRDGIGLFVQENAGGENSGIYVASGDIDLTGLLVGDVVDVTGVVAEDADGVLADLTQIDASGAGGSITDTGTDATATPVTVALSVLGNPTTAEAWEGVLVTVDETNDVAVTAENNFNEFEVSDGNDAVFVDDFLYNVYANAGTFPNMGVDATFESITGPLNYTYGDFKVAPRTAADLAGYVPTMLSGASVDDMNAGDLIITEIMYDPDFCTDTSCEYIEIYNDSGQDVNLNGLVIEDSTGNSVTVTQNAVLDAGTYGIIGQTSWGYMTVNPLAQASLPAFNNTGGDSASIANSTITIDSTASYAAQGSADDGYAWKLDQAPDAAANDVAGNWCYAPNTFEGMDYGSPGAANNAGCSNI
jgi:hypothetical protein